LIARSTGQLGRVEYSQTIQLALLGEVGTKQEIAGFSFIWPLCPSLISLAPTGFANRCAIKARNTKTVSPKFRVLLSFDCYSFLDHHFHVHPLDILDNFLQKQVVENMRKQGYSIFRPTEAFPK
jgi:hypothetical protein